jgi:uroporphyrinogen decarboxylase
MAELLSRKERVSRALNHESLDRLPIQFNYTAALGEKMRRYFGVELSNLPALLDNHIIRVDIDVQPRFSEDKAIQFDWWGAGFDTNEEGYFVITHPFGEIKDLDAYPWPDPHQPELFNKPRAIIRADASLPPADQYFILPNFGFALFERAWTLRGLDRLLVDMAVDPLYVEELLDRIVQIQLVLIRKFIDLGVDGGYFGDDYGAQKNMLFSPKMWRRFIKPRLAQLFEPFISAGLPVILHSDGQIQAILPDLVEIGLTALNPVQPEVLEHSWLRATFKDQLAYYGGISTQTVMPHGSQCEIRKAVADCIEVLATGDTGLVLAPSHRMMTDIPMENIAALVEAFAGLRGD